MHSPNAAYLFVYQMNESLAYLDLLLRYQQIKLKDTSDLVAIEASSLNAAVCNQHVLGLMASPDPIHRKYQRSEVKTRFENAEALLDVISS